MRLKEACVRACVRAILRPSIGRRGALGPRCLPPCCREYVCRFCSCPKQFTFFVTPLNLVDLLAILPFYISLILGQGKVRRPCAHALRHVLPHRVAPLAATDARLTRTLTWQMDPFGCRDDLDIDGNFFNQSAVGADDRSGVPNLGFLRAIRLVRIFRVFKFGRYSLGLQMFVGCLKASTQPLSLLAVIVVIASTLFGALINICEVSPQSQPRFCCGGDPRTAPPTVLALGGRAPRVRWVTFRTCSAT